MNLVMAKKGRRASTDFKSPLEKAIKEAADRKGISVKELAHLAKINESTIYKVYPAGMADVDTLSKLAMALKEEPDYFFKYNGLPPYSSKVVDLVQVNNNSTRKLLENNDLLEAYVRQFYDDYSPEEQKQLPYKDFFAEFKKNLEKDLEATTKYIERTRGNEQRRKEESASFNAFLKTAKINQSFDQLKNDYEWGLITENSQLKAENKMLREQLESERNFTTALKELLHASKT